MLWYKGRHKRPAGWETRSVHMTLAPKDWRTIEEACVIAEDTVGYTISQIMHNWALARRAKQDEIDGMAKNRAAELFAADKARNGDDSWQIKE